jgi:porin
MTDNYPRFKASVPEIKPDFGSNLEEWILMKNAINKSTIAAVLTVALLALPVAADETAPTAPSQTAPVVDVLAQETVSDQVAAVTTPARIMPLAPTGTDNTPTGLLNRALSRISLERVYTGEYFSNFSGGILNRGARDYRGNVDLTLGVDLWRGAAFTLYGQNGHGRGISDRYVGDLQVVSNIDAHEFSQISEYWIEQNLFGEKLRVVLGKQDANADFCALEYSGDFINSSYGPIPTIPMPTFPDPALGIVSSFRPVDWFSVGMGHYDGAASGASTGFDTAFDGDGVTFSIVEMAIGLSLGLNGSDINNSGTYRVGFWRHSDEFDEITGEPDGAVFSGNYGYYVACDQLLYRVGGQDSGRGIGGFIQYGWAPDERSEVARYYGGGMAFIGLTDWRPEDVAGLSVGKANLSNRFAEIDGRTGETTIELFYKLPIGSLFMIQPDLQYVINPSGDGQSAFVFGLRFENTF